MKHYTSDLHFGHKNIIKYEDRPFSTIEEMDEHLIYKWNNKVKKNDDVYILGDFGFVTGIRANELLDRLNGKKFLIKGNHDNSFLKDKKFDVTKFEWIKDYACINDNGKVVCMFHYPIAVWDRQHHGSIHLYGHVHSNKDNHHPLLMELNNAYNVGCDVHNFEPVTLEEILQGGTGKNNTELLVRDSKRFCESESDHNWVEYTNGKSSVFICQKCYVIKN